MKGYNHIVLLGNVGKDPEVRSTTGGTTVASLSLAVGDREKVNGEWQDVTEWFNIVAFNKTAEVLRDYVKKGNPLFVEGKVKTRSWEDKQSGETKYRTEVIVDQVVLLGGNDRPSAETKATVARIRSVPPNVEIDDEHIPF